MEEPEKTKGGQMAFATWLNIMAAERRLYKQGIKGLGSIL